MQCEQPTTERMGYSREIYARLTDVFFLEFTSQVALAGRKVDQDLIIRKFGFASCLP